MVSTQPNLVHNKREQLVPLSSSHASGLARICMRDDQLAQPCTGNVGVANFVGALWSEGGGAWGFKGDLNSE